MYRALCLYAIDFCIVSAYTIHHPIVLVSYHLYKGSLFINLCLYRSLKSHETLILGLKMLIQMNAIVNYELIYKTTKQLQQYGMFVSLKKKKERERERERESYSIIMAVYKLAWF
jgi:hypothetical protein